MTGTSPSRRLRRHGREWLTGYLFILPSVLLIGIFGIFPIGYAIYMSLYRWRVRRSSFVGLANYQEVLGSAWGALGFALGLAAILLAHWLWLSAFRTHRGSWLRAATALVLLAAGVTVALGWRSMMATTGEEAFLRSIIVTLFYALGTVPLQIVLALVLAYLLFQNIRGREGFRMIYFLPYVTPMVASAVVFAELFSPRGSSLSPGNASVANKFMNVLGLEPQRWLFEPRPVLELLLGEQLARFNAWLQGLGLSWQLEGLWLGPSLALFSIILFGIWTYTGLNVVIFLAGLGGISKQLYEAAEIDGANSAQQFWHITVPLLSPVTFYLTLLGFIGTLQAFTQLYVMRTPFARDTVDTASIVIFDTFYKLNNFSLAAAESVLLFVLILFLTAAQQRMFGDRVFYG